MVPPTPKSIVWRLTLATGCELISLEADVQITSFIPETRDVFCRAGSDQQAQLSTHLAEGLNLS